jgi:hypothetical protein
VTVSGDWRLFPSCSGPLPAAGPCQAGTQQEVKLGSAELSAPEKVGDETTNLFSPLEKFQRGIH